MLLPLIALILQSKTIPQLDALAQAKDTQSLTRYFSDEIRTKTPNILQFLTDGGAYGVGRFGWHVYRLQEVDGAVDAVFSTPLTCEDMGEQVFRWNGQKLSSYLPESDDYGIRLLHHDITAHFDIPTKTASFTDKVDFDNAGSSASGFLFRLGDHFNVLSIVDSSGQNVPFASAGGVVSVKAPESKGKFAYTISYTGKVDLPQYAGSISDDEILLAQDYWYPTLGRQASSYNLTAYTPANWKVEAQGVIESQKVSGSQLETKSQMDLPVVYFSFSAAPFTVAEDHIGSWDFSAFSKETPEDQLHIRNQVQSDVIAFYDKEYAPYPFKTWGTVATKTYGGGALEAYSYATYGDLPGEDPHEPSHTWWGGILPNSYLKSEWNESFAVFSEGLFQRERDLGNKEERRKAFVSDAGPNPLYNAAPVDDAPPEIGPAASSLGYGKGAAVLQMLEQEIGTGNLLNCFHEWIRSHKPGTLAEWPEFEAAVNRVTGSDCSWFFKQWLSRPGWPSFDFQNVRYEDGKITGVVHFDGPTYRIKIEVMIEFANGHDRFQTLEIGNGNDNFEIPCPPDAAGSVQEGKPVLVSFDPWRRLLRTYGGDEAPYSLSSLFAAPKVYVDPAHPEWMSFLHNSLSLLPTIPSDLNGVIIVGSPDNLPVLQGLCSKAGFQVQGNQLTYDGTTIDLENGAAMAVVDLPGGGHCGIALGKTLLPPNPGRSRLCLVDKYGRFLRGVTEPKRGGTLTYRL